MYNYFEIRDKIKADGRYVLPVDINAPIKEDFKAFPVVLGWIENVEKHLQVRRLEIVPKDKPHIRIVIQADHGMVEGYDKITEIMDAKNHVSDYLHIKNKNLNKKRPK